MAKQPAQTAATDEPTQPAALQITPQLVEAITEKVYALWRRDLQYEKERTRRKRPFKKW